jgi:GT2 family glycosyltransferase
MTPVVSVCIANYNGIGLIDTCIESVLAQDGHLAIEIIIHDDASTDGSAAHIRARYPDVTLIDSEDNVGFCIANNRMAEKACGKYLLLLNNDAVLMEDALTTLHTEALQASRSAILTLPQFDFDSGELIDRGCLLDPFFNPVPNLDAHRRDVAMVIGACMWLPKPLWHELGGFPEWFESIAEDMYLCCRARLAGYAVKTLNQSGYYHHVGRSFGGGKVTSDALVTTLHRRALSERNKTYVMLLIYPTLPLAVIFPLHVVMLQLEGVLLSLVKRNFGIYAKIYLPLFPAIWRERRRLVQLRRAIQDTRTISFGTFQKTMHWTLRKAQMLLRHGLPQVRETGT